MSSSSDNTRDPTEATSALGRWARRKAESQVPADGDAAQGPAPDVAPTDAEHGADAPVEPVAATEVLTDADMPDIDSLKEGSDFTPFMNPGVSEALRRRALSRLFRLPFFNVRDGLDDYDDDFRSFIPLGDTVTADMRFEQRRLEEKARELLEQEENLGGTAITEDGKAAKSGTPDNESQSEERSGDDVIKSTDHRRLASGEQHEDEDDIGEAEDDSV